MHERRFHRAPITARDRGLQCSSDAMTMTLAPPSTSADSEDQEEDVEEQDEPEPFASPPSRVRSSTGDIAAELDLPLPERQVTESFSSKQVQKTILIVLAAQFRL